VVVNRGQTGFLYQEKLHGLHRQKNYDPGAPKRIRPTDLLFGNRIDREDWSTQGVTCSRYGWCRHPAVPHSFWSLLSGGRPPFL
jgi:hypothetical protein